MRQLFQVVQNLKPPQGGQAWAGLTAKRFYTMELKSQEWFNILIDDCVAIYGEKEFNARLELIESYHEIGTRILGELKDKERVEIYGDKIVAEVGKAIKKSRTTVYRMIKFAKLFPDLQVLLNTKDKRISWSRIVREHLQEKAELPALPNDEVMMVYVGKHAKFLVENLKQSKKGVSFFLPYDYINEVQSY